MKTLHLYLTRQVLATLLMTVGVFTFVLLLGNVLKEILSLLINRQATLIGVAEAIGLLIPFVLVFALPMGMLTAALLVFGRFSADQELTAARSSGISLVALIMPILALSLLLCGVSAWINMEVAPRCRIAYKELLTRMGYKVAGTLLPQDRFLTFGKNTVYVGGNDGHELSDILVFIQPDSTNSFEFVIKAPRGVLEVSNQQVTLRLFDARSVQRRVGEENWIPGVTGNLAVVLPSPADNSSDKKPQLTDMTFGQLQAELRRLERRFSQADTGEMEPDEMRKWAQELQNEKQDVTMPVRVQIHRQVASAFACFGFTLVGIPLGIRAHRRETNAGVAMALALVFIYYSFVIVGQALQTHAEWAPHLIVWLPNFIFQSAGAVMLWRANRGI